jgi:hypothetical protein
MHPGASKLSRHNRLAPTFGFAQRKKTGATSDVAPAEENILNPVLRQTTWAAAASGLRDNKLTTTKLTNPTARL